MQKKKHQANISTPGFSVYRQNTTKLHAGDA